VVARLEVEIHVQAISTYSMSVFPLPKGLCNDINSLTQKFWWGHQKNESRIHWMSWGKMGVAKSRGLGFQDLVIFNKALLAKQGWWLLMSPEKALGIHYYPNCSILEALVEKKPSYAWRSIHRALHIVKEGLLWRIRNGQNVQIWGDKWIPKASTYKGSFSS
jgi:hypothetical protein